MLSKIKFYTVYFYMIQLLSSHVKYIFQKFGSGFKGRRGAPRMNLLNVLRNDINTLEILEILRI